VATRKNNNKKESQGSQVILIFWLIFIIVIISVFMINAETIQKNFNVFKTRMTASSPVEDDLLEFEEEYTEIAIEQQTQPERQPEQTVTPQAPVSETPPQTQTPTVTQTPPQVETPSQTQTPPPTRTPPETQPVQTRDRSVYFTQVNNDGQILQSRVTRRLPVTQSPMLDSLNTLLAGPTAEELNRGILNLIPRNTRILTAAIRGNTAYVNFSEDFLFNTFGVEGYVAQLRQIVWTVTEFSNVNDVQILIEGRRLDYLGEGIWIGSPISRQSF